MEIWKISVAKIVDIEAIGIFLPMCACDIITHIKYTVIHIFGVDVFQFKQ